MRVIIQDNRELIGQFLAFDKHMNLVLADTEEFRRVGGKGKEKDEKVIKRSLGLVILRGEIIVSCQSKHLPLLRKQETERLLELLVLELDVQPEEVWQWHLF